MILTKEITQTINEFLTQSPCNEAGDGYVYMQGTDVKSQIQCMNAIYILRGCYDLLHEAGYNVIKDESDQSLTIWGLKLKFVTLTGYASNEYVNINAPDINYTFDICVATSNYQSSTFTKTNYFLQRSSMHSRDMFEHEPLTAVAQLGYYHGLWLTHHNYRYTEGDDSKCTILLTLYCSNDGIQICYKFWRKSDDVYSNPVPLLSIYKGKNKLNNKNILIVGQMLEKAPFATCGDSTYHSSSNGNIILYGVSSIDRYGTYYSDTFLWHPFASSYICSGSNIIYEYDEENSKWTKTDETLYLDAEEYMGDTSIDLQLLDGVATGNFGKYEIYGIAKVKEKVIGFLPNTFYEINDKKYWCRHANLHSGAYQAPSNYKIKYLNGELFVLSSGYYRLNNSLYTSMFLLQSKCNSFGCGVIYPPKTYQDLENLKSNNPYFYHHSECKPSSDCLNPFIFLRIDDEIIDETNE